MVIKNKKLKKRSKSLSTTFFHVFLGALLLVVVAFLVLSNFKINKKRGELSVQISELEKELKSLEEKKLQSESALLRAQTDEFWEEKWREQGYKKPGEEVLVVFPQEEIKEAEVEKEKSFWQRLLERFRF